MCYAGCAVRRTLIAASHATLITDGSVPSLMPARCLQLPSSRSLCPSAALSPADPPHTPPHTHTAPWSLCPTARPSHERRPPPARLAAAAAAAEDTVTAAAGHTAGASVSGASP